MLWRGHASTGMHGNALGVLRRQRSTLNTPCVHQHYLVGVACGVGGGGREVHGPMFQGRECFELLPIWGVKESWRGRG
jgi:hypothetical protein